MIWLALGLFLGYVGWTTFKYGVPLTLSDTYYKIKYPILFSAMLWCVGFLVLPSLMDTYPHDTKIVPFMTICGMLLVGAAPRVHEYERTIHVIGALIALVGSIITIWGSPVMWILLPGSLGILISAIKCKLAELEKELDKWNCVFWCEISCFLALFLYLL